MNIQVRKEFIFLFLIIIAMGVGSYFTSFLDNPYMVLGFIILLALLSSTILYIGLRNRIAALIKAYVKSIRSMDFTSKDVKSIPKDIKSQLDILTNNIKENLRTQVEISTRLFSICERLNIVSMESLNSIERIASSIELADKNALEQSNMLMDASEIANEVVKSLEKLEEDIIERSQFISESITIAQGSMENINRIGDRIKESRDMAERTLREILTLNSYSDEIVSLIDIINSISKETNMLSLNASIEAARAGQEGKGFAVVAMEIGKLAQATKEASSKIEKVIQILRGHIMATKELMEDEMEYIEENWAVMLNTNEEFKSIIERLNRGKESLEEITHGIKEKNLSIRRIAENIDNVTSFSQEIVSHAQETTLQAMEQNSRAKDLQQMAKDIKEEVFGMQQFVAGNIMEEIMLGQAYYIKEYASKKKVLDDDDIEELLKRTRMDAIYITDSEGVVQYTSEKSAIGLNLYEADKSFLPLKEGEREYVVTPIKARVEDGKLFKFLTVVDEEKRLYEVGLSLESLLK